MKKGLLLSVVASTIIFAGGDIAPVEPAAPASSDFWGQIGFRYQPQSGNSQTWGSTTNNSFSVAAVLGVEKQLDYGFGIGAEVAGWTNLGLKHIAANPAVDAPASDLNGGELSQLYLTYTNGNTAVKVGRQALPKAVSPWAWSDRSVGVIDNSFEGVVVANTSLPGTTLAAAWIRNSVRNNKAAHIGRAGLFMLAGINKSWVPNTTLSMSAYYVPNYVGSKNVYSVWTAAESKFDGGISTGLQLVYVGGTVAGKKTSWGAAAYIGKSFNEGNGNVKLTVAHTNKGTYTLNMGGTSAFWGNALGGFLKSSGDTIGATQNVVRLNADYKVGIGTAYGELAYANYGSSFGHAWGTRLGYKFKVGSVDANVEYRYANYKNHPTLTSSKMQRVRVEAYYKF